MFRTRTSVFSSLSSEWSPMKIVNRYCGCTSSDRPPRRENDSHRLFLNYSKNEYNYFKKYRYLAFGLVPVITYYLYKKNLSWCSIIPNVEAATRQSLRTQYNFIADTVEKAAGAVVCIDIKDTHK